MRAQHHEQILAIQHTIDQCSWQWITTGSMGAYAEYGYWVQELTKIKTAILAHERVYGFDN